MTWQHMFITRALLTLCTRMQAEFVGTLFFLFFTITTVVYRTDFAGGQVKPTRADANTKDFVDLVGTTGSAAQLMIASIFGCAVRVHAAMRCLLMQCDALSCRIMISASLAVHATPAS